MGQRQNPYIGRRATVMNPGGAKEQVSIARAVIVSLGGLRVGKTVGSSAALAQTEFRSVAEKETR